MLSSFLFSAVSSRFDVSNGVTRGFFCMMPKLTDFDLLDVAVGEEVEVEGALHTA